MSTKISSDADVQLYLKAMKAYYSGEKYLMSDSEFDSLERKVLESTKMTRKDYLEYIFPDHVKVKHTIEFPQPYQKVYISDKKDLKKEGYSYNTLIPTYKFDGCSIVVYYKDCKPYLILTRSDEEFGVNKTESLIKKAPKVKSELVKAVLCEAVVESDGKDTSRNRANGLINSKYMQDAVEKEIYLQPYDVVLEGKPQPYEIRMEYAGLKIPFMFHDDVFKTSEVYDPYRFTPERIRVDGVVWYSKDNPEEIWITKFDNEVPSITDVIGIDWIHSEDTGRYAPVLVLKPIEVKGTMISRVKVGPYSKLAQLKCGIGAQIEIKKSGSTIPIINKVLTQSEDYAIPRCECGAKLRTLSTNLVCSSHKCSWMKSRIMYMILTWWYEEEDENLIRFCADGYKDVDFIRLIKERTEKAKTVREAFLKENSFVTTRNDLVLLLKIPSVTYDSTVPLKTLDREEIEDYISNLTELQQEYAKMNIDTLLNILSMEVR